jgi:membrane-associated phospholipid phosphatase
MYNLILRNKAFLIPYSIVLLVILFFLVHYSKAEIHLFINHFHNPVADIFFKYLTYLGDGITLPLYLLFMVMIRFRHAILLIVVFLLSGLIVQILKRAFFEDVMRPAGYFKGIADLYFVPGVVQNCCKSFPSGHSATAFGLMISFCFALKNNGVKFLTFVFACLIAYSRMYLSQHFLVDITVGSLIGTITALVLEFYNGKFTATWLDENILNYLKK